jgi:hypothetical protein
MKNRYIIADENGNDISLFGRIKTFLSKTVPFIIPLAIVGAIAIAIFNNQ